MNTVKAAVQQALNPQAAKAAEARKLAALMAFGIAVGASVDADREAEAQGVNAWEQYALASAYGASADEIADTTLADMDGASDDYKRIQSRCRQYAMQCRALSEAGVTLLQSEGRIRESVTVTIDGKPETGTLGGIAQKLMKAKAKAGGAKRGTKTRTSGADDSTDNKTEGPTKVGVVNVGDLSSLPVTPELVERVGQALATVEGAKLRAVLQDVAPDAILTMAAAITAKRAQAQAIREEQKAANEAKRAQADARRHSDAAELSEDAIADAMLHDLTAYTGMSRDEMVGA